METAGRRVLLLERFDRRGRERVPFLSAMGLLGAADNETYSYPEIADALRRHGAAVAEDLPELWRRMVLTCWSPTRTIIFETTASFTPAREDGGFRRLTT